MDTVEFHVSTSTAVLPIPFHQRHLKKRRLLILIDIEYCTAGQEPPGPQTNQTPAGLTSSTRFKESKKDPRGPSRIGGSIQCVDHAQRQHSYHGPMTGLPFARTSVWKVKVNLPSVCFEGFPQSAPHQKKNYSSFCCILL